jgi:hypothetical protein
MPHLLARFLEGGSGGGHQRQEKENEESAHVRTGE